MLTGPEKAVLFLLSLDEHCAAPIVGELSIKELKKLREVASTMREVSTDALDITYKEFIERTSGAVAIPRGGLPYLRRLTTTAHGSGSAAEVFDDAASSNPLARLESAPPEAVATLLADESAQLVGAILARLEPKVAATILAAMPAQREAAVLARLSKLSELPAGLLEDVATALANDLPSSEAETLISIDGVSKAADILNAAGRQQSQQVLEAIEEEEPELARSVRLAMFTFFDLKAIDPRSMRTLLREVPTERLTIALKGAPEDVASAIFAGLSQRAANLIRDDLEVLGKVRKGEIEAARQEVIQVALRLEADGIVDLGRGDD
jgi:flagellar motor switch protein FliG